MRPAVFGFSEPSDILLNPARKPKVFGMHANFVRGWHKIAPQFWFRRKSFTFSCAAGNFVSVRHGFIFPEAPASQVPEKPKSAEEIKDAEFVQTSYGRGYFKYLVYIGIPLMILIIAMMFLVS